MFQALLISQSANKRTEVSPVFNVKVIVRGQREIERRQ